MQCASSATSGAGNWSKAECEAAAVGHSLHSTRGYYTTLPVVHLFMFARCARESLTRSLTHRSNVLNTRTRIYTCFSSYGSSCNLSCSTSGHFSMSLASVYIYYGLMLAPGFLTAVTLIILKTSPSAALFVFASRLRDQLPAQPLNSL